MSAPRPRSRAAYAPVKTKVAVDPAVQKILEDLAAYRETPEVFSVFDELAADNVFDSVDVFGASADPGAVFDMMHTPAFDVDVGSVFDIARKSLTIGRPDLFDLPVNLHAPTGRKMVVTRYTVPAPEPEPPKTYGYWLSGCDYQRCFDSRRPDWLMPGRGWDFAHASESMGYLCVEEDAFGAGRDHVANTEGWCERHHLIASPYEDISEALNDSCDHMYFEYAGAWAELLPHLLILRETVFEHLDQFTATLENVRWIYQKVGIRDDEVPFHPRRAIVEAAEFSRDRGLAAAFVDEYILTFPEAFGALGKLVQEGYAQVNREGWLQQLPEQVLIFARLHEPVFAPEGGDPHAACMHGSYRMTHGEYFSALPTKYASVTGFFGWTLKYMVPTDLAGHPS